MTSKQLTIKYNEDIETIKELKGETDHYGKHVLDNCDCGKKKIAVHNFCPKCKKEIEERFRTMILKEFSLEEIEHIDSVIEGYYLTDYMKGDK